VDNAEKIQMWCIFILVLLHCNRLDNTSASLSAQQRFVLQECDANDDEHCTIAGNKKLKTPNSKRSWLLISVKNILW
jgi:hypothetical protein